MTAVPDRSILSFLRFRPTVPGPALSHHPLIGILGVLLGAIISTLTARITAFGLADIRGAINAGFDEGAWITT
ncbi:MAG TPA: hypothetical protein VEX87_11155, partial [Skermanella sp.]|nr:hypothetical protein [Skermanella sp.]